ncbi:MAG: hypothetical protein AMXMBFR13_09260 [Phycisphaerae bacterium]
MKTLNRHAFTLVEIITLLPILAVGMIIAHQLTNSALRMQTRESRAVQQDASTRDLVRRIQRDVEASQEAAIEPDNGTVLLRLTGQGTTITYEIADSRVRRMEQSGEVAEPVVFWWDHDGVDIDLHIEQIDREQLVWIHVSAVQPMERGPGIMHSFAATARVNRGGTS